ncbi:MAG: hypothetical protein ACRDG4_11440 [Chloroflexota bacterium]
MGDDAYGFVHDVIREVVEGDLGLGRRRLLHRQVGTALETMPGTRQVEAVAYHFQQAGERARAAPYLEQAGDLAEARYAHEEAAHYQDLTVCLEELGNVSDLVRVLEKLAGVLGNMGRHGAAIAALERWVEIPRLSGDLDEWAGSRYGSPSSRAKQDPCRPGWPGWRRLCNRWSPTAHHPACSMLTARRRSSSCITVKWIER